MLYDTVYAFYTLTYLLIYFNFNYLCFGGTKIGKLENWKIGKLENWKIDYVDTCQFGPHRILYLNVLCNEKSAVCKLLQEGSEWK